VLKGRGHIMIRAVREHHDPGSIKPPAQVTGDIRPEKDLIDTNGHIILRLVVGYLHTNLHDDWHICLLFGMCDPHAIMHDLRYVHRWVPLDNAFHVVLVACNILELNVSDGRVVPDRGPQRRQHGQQEASPLAGHDPSYPTAIA